MSLNADEQKALVDLLAKLDPGFLPYEIFKQFARLMALPIIELVPLRRTQNGRVEILLLERTADDEFWPGEIHTPGTVLRADDLPGGIKSAFDRITKDELNDTSLTEPIYVSTLFQKSKRGGEMALIYYVEVLGDPKIGRFYDSEELPENVIESQRHFISTAVAEFKKI